MGHIQDIIHGSIWLAQNFSREVAFLKLAQPEGFLLIRAKFEMKCRGFVGEV